MKRSATIKVGLLTLVSLSILVFVLIWLRGRGLPGGEDYTVRFRDVDGMREGAQVQMMGIRIGFVDTVDPEILNGRYYVRVHFTISRPGIHVPQGAVLSIQQTGLIGEKFLEITPPQLREVVLPLPEFVQAGQEESLQGMSVRFRYEEGDLVVGRVEKADMLQVDVPLQDEESLPRNRLRLQYRITRAGAVMPKSPVFQLVVGNNGKRSLLILPSVAMAQHAPDRNLVFTIENPMRLAQFLQVQMDSAEALKVTNDRISQLLSDETIATMNSTLVNMESLTSRASDVLASAQTLLQSTHKDLELLVQASQQLSDNITQVSNNVNDVIGDPSFKTDVKQTVASIQESTTSLKKVLQDPALKETITATRDTSQSVAELTAMLKRTAENKDLQARLDHSLTSLNDSLDKLSSVLSDMEGATGGKDPALKSIVQDTRETAENMKRFSKRLNGRFLLFRLLF